MRHDRVDGRQQKVVQPRNHASAAGEGGGGQGVDRGLPPAGLHGKLLRRRRARRHRVVARGKARGCPGGAVPPVAARVAHAQRARGPGLDGDRRRRGVWSAAAQGRAIGARQDPADVGGTRASGAGDVRQDLRVCVRLGDGVARVLGGSDRQACVAGGVAGGLSRRRSALWNERGRVSVPSLFGVGWCAECTERPARAARSASRQGQAGAGRPRRGASALGRF